MTEKRAPIELVNAERPRGDRPEPAPSSTALVPEAKRDPHWFAPDAPEMRAHEARHGRYWRGSAGQEPNYWRDMYEAEHALRVAIEKRVAELESRKEP